MLFSKKLCGICFQEVTYHLYTEWRRKSYVLFSPPRFGSCRNEQADKATHHTATHRGIPQDHHPSVYNFCLLSRILHITGWHSELRIFILTSHVHQTIPEEESPPGCCHGSYAHQPQKSNTVTLQQKTTSCSDIYNILFRSTISLLSEKLSMCSTTLSFQLLSLLPFHNHLPYILSESPLQKYHWLSHTLNLLFKIQLLCHTFLPFLTTRSFPVVVLRSSLVVSWFADHKKKKLFLCICVWKFVFS